MDALAQGLCASENSDLSFVSLPGCGPPSSLQIHTRIFGIVVLCHWVCSENLQNSPCLVGKAWKLSDDDFTNPWICRRDFGGHPISGKFLRQEEFILEYMNMPGTIGFYRPWVWLPEGPAKTTFRLLWVKARLLEGQIFTGKVRMSERWDLIRWMVAKSESPVDRFIP